MDGEENKVGAGVPENNASETNNSLENNMAENAISESNASVEPSISAESATTNATPATSAEPTSETKPEQSSSADSESVASTPDENAELTTGPIISSGKKPEEKPEVSSETKLETNSEAKLEAKSEAKPEKAPKTPPITPNFMSTPAGANSDDSSSMSTMNDVSAGKVKKSKKNSTGKTALLCVLMLLLGGGIGFGATMLFTSLNDSNSSVQIAAGPVAEEDAKAEDADSDSEEKESNNVDYKFESIKGSKGVEGRKYNNLTTDNSDMLDSWCSTVGSETTECEVVISPEGAKMYKNEGIASKPITYVVKGEIRQVTIGNFGQMAGIDDILALVMADGTVRYDRGADIAKNGSVNLKTIEGVNGVVNLETVDVAVGPYGHKSTIAKRADGRFYDLYDYVVKE